VAELRYVSRRLHSIKLVENNRISRVPSSSFKIVKAVLQTRLYSTNSSVVVASGPVKLYKNADLDKLKILKENRGKSGVYRWVNLENGNSYIGSSTDLRKRFISYFNFSYISKKNNMLINRALLKWGYSNFSLEILEYCDSTEAVSREQHFLDLLKPEYNVLSKAGSLLGYKHSEETVAKLKGRTLTTEHIAKLKSWSLSPENKEHLKIINANPEQKARRLEQLRILHSSKEHQEHLKRLHTIRLQQVSVLDSLNNETTIYPSITEAAQVIGCTKSTISKVLKHQEEKRRLRLVKKRYLVTLFKESSSVSSESEEIPKFKGRVEVVDTLTGNTTAYPSIRQAAQGIGVVHATINKALKNLNENGESRLIKQRLRVKIRKVKE
jgi:group I intron endonuclease